jgi:hypothetical protein
MMMPDVRMWHPSSMSLWYAAEQGTGNRIAAVHVPYYSNRDEKLIYYHDSNRGFSRWERGGVIPEYPTLCPPESAPEGGTSIKPAWTDGPAGNRSIFGSYTWDPRRVWFCDRPTYPRTNSYVAVSNNGGDTWDRKTDLPFRAGVASGFPYNNQLFIVGRHQYNSNHLFTQHLVASYDGGDTWEDKTGDLMAKIEAAHGAGPLTLAVAITTIAPEW